MYVRKQFLTVFIFFLLGSLFALAQNSGAEVFSVRCANCHGADGAGKPSAVKMFNGMPDLRASDTQSRTDRQLFDSIGRGIDHKKYPHVFLQTGLTQSEVQ